MFENVLVTFAMLELLKTNIHWLKLIIFIAMLWAELDRINGGDNNLCCEIKDTFTEVVLDDLMAIG